MKNIYDDNNKLVDINTLQLLSTNSSEMTVYNNTDFVYKVFKKDYKLEHKDVEELNYLISIKTSRILMPKSKIFSDGKLIGYTMEYIKEKKDILNDKMLNLVKELSIIKEDIELLSNFYVRLIDINKSNIIYNGKLYLIDPGNYYINNIKDLLICFENRKITDDEKQKIIRIWNYNKINMLIYEILFMNNSDIDFYLLRKIIEFFRQERKKEGLLYDLSIYQKYFDRDLFIKDSINKFVSNYIKIDKEERNRILSLYKS